MSARASILPATPGTLMRTPAMSALVLLEERDLRSARCFINRINHQEGVLTHTIKVGNDLNAIFLPKVNIGDVVEIAVTKHGIETALGPHYEDSQRESLRKQFDLADGGARAFGRCHHISVFAESRIMHCDLPRLQWSHRRK